VRFFAQRGVVRVALAEYIVRALRSGWVVTRGSQQLELFDSRPKKSPDVEQLYLGRGLDVMLDMAEEARMSWEDEYISVEHMLLAFAEKFNVLRVQFDV